MEGFLESIGHKGISLKYKDPFISTESVSWKETQSSPPNYTQQFWEDWESQNSRETSDSR